MSIRSGLRASLRAALRSGLNPSDAADPLASVTRDATSLVYCPANATEFATVLSVANDTVGGPSALFLCQEDGSVGHTNLADSIGTFPLAAAGTGITYAQPVTGWSRKGVLFADGGTGTFTSTDVGLPDISTTSFAAIAYWSATAPAANRTFMGFGTTTTVLGLVNATTNFGRILSGANNAVGLQAATGQVRPWVLMHNKTGTIDQLYNDLEKMPTPVFSATTTGKQIQFGSSAHCPGSLVYLALFFGAAAERTSTQWKTLLQTLNWSPAFT